MSELDLPYPPYPPSEALKELAGKYDAADWRKALMDELLRVQAFRIMTLSTHDHLDFELATDIADKFKDLTFKLPPDWSPTGRLKPGEKGEIFKRVHRGNDEAVSPLAEDNTEDQHSADQERKDRDT